MKEDKKSQEEKTLREMSLRHGRVYQEIRVEKTIDIDPENLRKDPLKELEI